MRGMKHIKRLTSKWELLFHLPKIMMAILALFFISSCSNNRSALNVLKKKRFVMIKMGDSTDDHFEVGLDLDKK